MHSVYFVLVPVQDKKEEAESAINRAENWLTTNNFASDNNGFYGSSKADWFEMGGRWSGIFTEMSLPKAKLEKFDAEVKEIEKKHGEIWTETAKKYKGGSKEWIEAYPKLDKAKQEELVACWKKHFPKVGYAPPIARKGSFTFEGFPRKDSDDAIKMTLALFKRWKSEYGKQGTFNENGSEFVSFDENECGDEGLVRDLKFKDVKDKWVVVVDYHY